jgi:hypothetical protein
MFIIFMLKWNRGEELELANEFSLLALVFFSFVSNGQLTYMGITNLSMFLAVVDRMAKVMQMEE